MSERRRIGAGWIALGAAVVLAGTAAVLEARGKRLYELRRYVVAQAVVEANLEVPVEASADCIDGNVDHDPHTAKILGEVERSFRASVTVVGGPTLRDVSVRLVWPWWQPGAPPRIEIESHRAPQNGPLLDRIRANLDARGLSYVEVRP